MTDITPGQISLLQWGIREGGAFVVILVILFFYRRDWKTATDYWKEQNAKSMELAMLVVKVMAECTNALKENTVVTHGLKRVFERQFPMGRRSGDLIDGKD